MKNLVKTKLQEGKPSVGTWLGMNNPDVSEQLARLGFDWLVFDVEHGLHNAGCPKNDAVDELHDPLYTLGASPDQ